MHANERQVRRSECQRDVGRACVHVRALVWNHVGRAGARVRSHVVVCSGRYVVEEAHLVPLNNKDYRLQLDSMFTSSDEQVLTTAGETKTDSKSGDEGSITALDKQVLTPVNPHVDVGESPVAPNAAQKGEAEATGPASTALAMTKAIRLPRSLVDSGQKRPRADV